MKRVKSIIKQKPDKMLRRKGRGRPTTKRPSDPDSLPLPKLDADRQHQVEAAIQQARVVLQTALVQQWQLEYPLSLDERTVRKKRPDLRSFFPPFKAFAVAVYRAYAAAFLKLNPSLRDYQAWLNYGLKEKILNDIAPYRPTAADRMSIRSGWEDSMWESWRRFDHPHHVHSQKQAKRLAESMDGERRSAFVEALSKALIGPQEELLAVALSGSGPKGLTELQGPEAVSERRRALIRNSPKAKDRTFAQLADDVGATTDVLYAMARSDKPKCGDARTSELLEKLEISPGEW